mgnify:CR=1 FL=1
MEHKLKRFEWLNLFSKGFVVESINNNYKNEDIKINKLNKESSNKKKEKFNSKEIKNISFEKLKLSTQSNKNDYYFFNLNELLPESIDNINLKEEMTIKSEAIPKQKEIDKKKKKNKIKTNSTININFINIEQNIIQKKDNKKKEIKNNRKELKNDISSPLLNYINTQKRKTNIIFKTPFLNTFNNEINNTNNKNKELEVIQKSEKLNNNFDLEQYMERINYNNNGKGKESRNKKNSDKEKDNKEIIDYTFDDEFLLTEKSNNYDFSDIYKITKTTKNQSNKKGLNIFFSGNTNSKNFRKNQFDEIKKIMNTLKK